MIILGKRIFVPYVDGPIMQMVESPRLGDIKSFTTNSWGIPEPSAIQGRVDGIIVQMRCEV
jgi:hypothetical protein